ncbi:RluA family pseudouridine synthase [Candidatus Formimonas warabiya]|uniref:Pseudouridine synthase n=1 Tax=Formimonas warabiya TaxID=1761012 RepID=A0A3G1KQW6_FORW1|nr:RluA family pseudouridine synthase [Candidatus Formimonas warabiya]ATW24869.1 RNA pseudouridine synthase [Candidatus Formimonas warabiya]
MTETIFQATGAELGIRIDLYLADKVSDLSRSRIQKLIKDGEVLVNGKTVKPNYAVAEGDEILIGIPQPEQLQLAAQEIPFEVLFEDQDLIVVNKPQGMVVHPAAGNYQGTLVNALLHHCTDLSGINGVMRPGIVHRIDKDTSGLLMVAKNDFAHMNLAKQIKDHAITRVYNALVHGTVAEPAGVIDAPIGRHPVHRKKMAVVLKNSKRAVTHYKVLERFSEYTLIEARLETGRTHQIRVHMSYLGYPVVGDPLYGPRKGNLDLKGQALHARVLGFHHPRSGAYMEFEAPLPPYFQELLQDLRNHQVKK